MKKLFKISSLLLCAFVLISSLAVAGYADDIVLGDIDGNGKVETTDAREILKMAGGIIPENTAVADINGDGVVSTADAIQALKLSANIGGVVIPDKNGDNVLSDKANNEFIELISSTYGIDSKALVAIYSVPDSGTNYVLQFKKPVLSNEYVKSPENLERVYHIGKAPEREISYTSGKLLTGNYNCEGAEGMLVFNLVKSEVMPLFPDYFTGV